jgi:hypothetical protein
VLFGAALFVIDQSKSAHFANSIGSAAVGSQSSSHFIVLVSAQ